MAGGRFTPEQINEIIDEYVSGGSITQMAIKYKRRRNCIYRVLCKNGFDTHIDKIREIPTSCLNQIPKLYELGYSVPQICEYLGCPSSIVDKQLRLAGIIKRYKYDSKAIADQMPFIADTIDDEDWLLDASVEEIIEKMVQNVDRECK